MWTSPTALESGRDSSHAIGTTGAMTYDDVRDGFNDYAQLTAECLPVSWVYDIGRTFVLRQGLHSISVAEHGDGRARQRRGLHRLGFRSVSSLSVRVWQWQVTSEMVTHELRARPPLADSEVCTPFLETLNLVLATDQLLQEQTVRVLRDVFRCAPSQLRLLAPREDEDDTWDDAAGWD